MTIIPKMMLPNKVPIEFVTVKNTLRAVMAFNEYIFDETIRNHNLYKECLDEFNGLFPQYEIKEDDKHIAIIGMMALKNAPYYGKTSFAGGSKGGFNGFAFAHGTQIFMLLYFLIMLWSSCLNMHNFVINDNIDILDPDTNEFRPIAIHDTWSRPVQLGKVVANYHFEAGKVELAEMTKEMWLKAETIGFKHMDKGIENIVDDFSEMPPKSNDGFFHKLSTWTTLCIGAVSGDLGRRSEDIITTRMSHTFANAFEEFVYENKAELNKIDQKIQAGIKKKVHDFNSYSTLFCRSAAGIITLIVTIPGTAGLQRLTNGNARRIKYGGKKKRKTRQKKQKTKQKRRNGRTFKKKN